MYCSIKGLNIRYEVVGSGKPLLIFNNSMAAHLEPILREYDLKRIYMDVPGMGKSKVGEWMKSSDDVLGIILSFIDTVIGAEKFLVFGLSYCGYLARGVLYKRPQQVDGAALICPVITADISRRNLPAVDFAFRDEDLYSSLNESDAEELDYYIIQDEKVWNKIKELRNTELGCYDMEFYGKLKETGCYDFSFDVDALSAPFERPVLVMAGMQDKVVGYMDTWKIISNFPRATFLTLDMAGHGILVEQERLFEMLLKDWLDRVEYKHKAVKV